MTFVKGQSGNIAGKPKGAKNATTILKEERRAIFDAEVSKMYLEKIKLAKPEYILDQFLGPVTNKHIVDSTLKVSTIPQQAIDIIEEDLVKKLTE